jgi:hypothetical protein
MSCNGEATSMSDSEKPLAAGDHGRYADLAARPLPEGLVLQFIPSLAAMLTRAEQLAGRPLTREEVLRVRDNCPVVVSEAEPARAVEEGRGYADLDPADPWPGWQELRQPDWLPGD